MKVQLRFCFSRKFSATNRVCIRMGPAHSPPSFPSTGWPMTAKSPIMFERLSAATNSS